MNKRKKREIMNKRKKRIQLIIISIISIVLITTLITSINEYHISTKKIEVREDIRNLILTIEAAEVNDSIEFDEYDTIAKIKSENGEKLEAIKKYSNINDFERIEDLTIENARKIICDETNFKIDSKGKFAYIYENN